MFAVDYAVALLDGDVENEYVDQTVDECRGAARDCPQEDEEVCLVTNFIAQQKTRCSATGF